MTFYRTCPFIELPEVFIQYLQRVGMPTGETHSDRDLVLSHLRLANVLIVEPYDTLNYILHQLMTIFIRLNLLPILFLFIRIGFHRESASVAR